MNLLYSKRADIGVLLIAAVAAAPATMGAQHEGHDMSRGASMVAGHLGISMDRMGSGTTWIPVAVSLPSRHVAAPGWMLMLHGFAFAYYNKQNGPRGSEDVGRG